MISLTAAAAAITQTLLSSRIAIPVVVVEIVFGVLIGPEVLGLIEADDFIDFFANLGLGMLFFFAGYEIDLDADPRAAAAPGGARLGAVARARLHASAACWRWPASCSRCSTRARRWPRRRSAR